MAVANPVALPRPRRERSLLIAGAALALCAVLAVVAVLGYRALHPSAVPVPVVRFVTPGTGQQVPVGQPLASCAVAEGNSPIVRMELWADGELQAVERSNLKEGVSPFPLVATWLPPSPGTHTLVARAFSAAGGRAHAAVTVEAIQPPDRDGDGVADGADASPDEAGPTVLDGRPLPVEEEGDAPPAEPAPPPPDADGDGVADERDLCPEAAGPADAGGCPPSGAGDRDGDGLADDVDLAPAEPGLPEHGGSPPPDSDGDRDGVPDEEEVPAPAGLAGLILRALRFQPPPPPPPEETLVELQVSELRTHQEYDRVVCYACLGGQPVERIDLERVDGMLWQLPAEYGAEAQVRVPVPPGQPFTMTIECGATRSASAASPEGTPEGGFGEGGAEEAYYDLGTLTASHAQEEWDGRRLVAQSVSPDADAPGRVFHMAYRLCEDSCEGSALPPPTAGLIHHLDGMYLTWHWDSDPEQIDGFSVWCYEGPVLVAIRTLGRDARSVLIEDLAPACGRTRTFWVSARRGDGVSSPDSNRVEWEGQACPGYLVVNFRSMGSRSHCESGPIYGQLWANEEVLAFDAADRFWGLEGSTAGLGLPERDAFGGCSLDIQDFFSAIRGLDPGWVDSYTAPASSRVYLPMYADSDLTIGVRIYEDNPDGADPVLAEGWGTIPASHLLSEDLNRSYGGDPYEEGRPAVGVIFMGFDADGTPYYVLAHSDGLLTFDLRWSGRPQAP